jgi:RHS repeat-associated protein
MRGVEPLKAGHSKRIYFLTDALGTVRDIVDENGDVVQSYEFNEHGIPLPGSGAGSVTSQKTYHGGLSVNDDLADTGLYLMGHRFWAPELGRFISRDPIGFAGGLNLFNGHGVSPVTMVDPAGLVPTQIIEIGLKSSQIDALNRQFGTSITAADIAAALQDRLRDHSNMANISVVAHEGQFAQGFRTGGTFGLNLDFRTHAFPGEPYGFSDPYRARVSSATLRKYLQGDIAKGVPCQPSQVTNAQEQNVIMNIILHEIGHALGAPAEGTFKSQGGMRNDPVAVSPTGLMMPKVDASVMSNQIQRIDPLSLDRISGYVGNGRNLQG